VRTARTRAPGLRRLLALIVAVAVIPGMAMHAPADAQSGGAAPASATGLALCLDGAGDPRTGALDILVLLDDSGSLQRTDPGGLRYEALDVLLRGLAALGGGDGFRDRNIALVSYGQRVEVLLPFRPLLGEEVAGVVADVRTRATGRQPFTDFIGGVRTAVDLLGDRPSANCRILVWFTDGDHHMAGRSSSTTLEDQVTDAGNLRAAFCGPNGLDARIRERGINTFALMLEPLPTRPVALEASKDVMQVITGDSAPGFVDGGGLRRAPTEGCSGALGPQVGRVLPASQAEQLPGIFADLPNEVEGAQPGVPELACPYVVDQVTSARLPDAHLIEWFSLTDFRSAEEARPPDLSRVTVVTADGEALPASAVMEEVARTDRVLRVRPRAQERDRLTAGWELRLTDAAATCLRVLPVTLTFRISTTEPRISAVRPAGLPERLFAEGQLEFVDRGSRGTLGLDAALRTAGVSGRLVVDGGELFSPDRQLPASIIVDGAPIVAAECVSLQIPAPGTLTAGRAGQLGGPEAPTDPLESSTCVIVPATIGDGGTLVWGETLAALNATEASCRVGEWTVLIDGVASESDRLVLTPGGAPVEVQLRSLVAPENEARDCTGVALPALTLEWQRTAAAIPVELSVAWFKRSSPLIAAAIASPAVLLVALLSLLLLRLINDRWMRPPDADALWGYEARGMLTLDRRGRPRIEWGRGAAGFEVDRESIGQVTGNGRDELRLEGTRLVRRMPGWLRPLDEPVLVVSGDDAAVAAHPPASRGRGTLPLGFREAVVLTADTPRLPTADDPVPVRVVVLVPRSADVAVSDAVQTIVQQRVDQLAERLLERLRELTGSEGGARVAAGAVGPSGPPTGPSSAAFPGAGPGSRPTGEGSAWTSAPPTAGPAGGPGAAPRAPAEPAQERPERRMRRGPAPVSASTSLPDDVPPPDLPTPGGTAAPSRSDGEPAGDAPVAPPTDERND
jgi:hypothetical protein